METHKLPPLADLDCERGVLGGLLLHPTMLPSAVADRVTSGVFAAPGHKAIFTAMIRLDTESLLAAPLGSLADELARAGDLSIAGGLVGLVGLLIDYLKPGLLQLGWERLVMLASARRMQRMLRQAQDLIERDPVAAAHVLAAIARVA